MNILTLALRNWQGVLIAAVLLSGACGKKNKGGNHDGGGGGPPPGGQQQQQGEYQATEIKANFGGAVGALVLDPSQGGMALQGDQDQGANSFVKITEDGEIASIFDIKKPENQCCGPQNGLPKLKTIAVSPLKEIFLHFESPFIYKSQDIPQYLPREQCQNNNGPMPPECHGPGEENPAWVDPWKMENGFQCQIFKVSGGTIDQLIAGETGADLECLDNKHFINSWQTTRNSVFQFDEDGAVYYPGSSPGSDGRMVVYKRTGDGAVSEVINANICVQDFLVTINGGVFYTGSSSCGGGGGNSGGFFRYVAPSGGQLREIARDWWNFVFEAAEGASGDQAVFFGPDPRSATTASWNTACLFRYDPSLGTTAQQTISGVITCGADFQSWLDLRRAEDITPYGRGFDEPNRTPSAAWRTEFQARCTSEGQVFAGGGSQINSIKQTSTGDVFVIGQVRKKRKGIVSCNVQVKGRHCVDKDGVPHLPTETDFATEALCTSKAGTWVDDGEGRCEMDVDTNADTIVDETRDFFSRSSADLCLSTALDHADVTSVAGGAGRAKKIRWKYQRHTDYNNVASPICTQSGGTANIWDWNNSTSATHMVASGTVADANITYAATLYGSEWWRCSPVADDGSVGSTNGGGDQWLSEYKSLAQVNNTTKSLELRSGVDEQAINLWLIGDVPYYSSYNTSQGRYFLKRYNKSNNQIETVASDFETYNLSEGTDSASFYYDGLNFATNEYSFGTINKTTFEFTQKTGLTGQVKMIIALPKD